MRQYRYTKYVQNIAASQTMGGEVTGPNIWSLQFAGPNPADDADQQTLGQARFSPFGLPTRALFGGSPLD